MNKKIEQYIQEHKILKANAFIFRDWNDFIHILYDSNDRIEMIIWYEYCKINAQQIGMSGYIDPENQSFMWAETQIFETNLHEKSLDDILEYMTKVQKENSTYDLYPEFYLH